jgi:hypothetical protein
MMGDIEGLEGLVVEIAKAIDLGVNIFGLPERLREMEEVGHEVDGFPRAV